MNLQWRRDHSLIRVNLPTGLQRVPSPQEYNQGGPSVVHGDWNLMSPEGAVLAIENWKSMMDRYLNFCKQQDISPVDVSSFSG